MSIYLRVFVLLIEYCGKSPGGTQSRTPTATGESRLLGRFNRFSGTGSRAKPDLPSRPSSRISDGREGHV